ncbi:MAG: MOSC domain-containing protein [Propionibacteriaceae bacterium]
MAHRLFSLHTYPMKSGRGIDLTEARLEPWGLAGDRRWMVITPDGHFVSQREHPGLATVTARPTEAGIRLSAPGEGPLEVAVPTPTEFRTVTLWRDRVEVVPCSTEADAWLTAVLGTPVQLVHLDDPATRRQVDQHYARPEDHVGFADGYPVLLTTTASLAALNELVAAGRRPAEGPLGMERFRPTLVIDGTDPWAEDGWRRVRVGETVLRVVKPCGRCVITTTDQQSGVRGREPLPTLGRHRLIGRKLVFGQNAVVEQPGTLRVGDELTVLD